MSFTLEGSLVFPELEDVRDGLPLYPQPVNTRDANIVVIIKVVFMPQKYKKDLDYQAFARILFRIQNLQKSHC